MKITSRRNFITNTAMTTIAGSTAFLSNTSARQQTEKNMFVHHVYFWLNDPSSKEDLSALVKGLESLSKIPYIKLFHIGKPADTNREVIDSSYNVSWLLVFNNKEEEERYQKDPVHLKFVEDCKRLWKKVVVYDSVDV